MYLMQNFQTRAHHRVHERVRGLQLDRWTKRSRTGAIARRSASRSSSASTGSTSSSTSTPSSRRRRALTYKGAEAYNDDKYVKKEHVSIETVKLISHREDLRRRASAPRSPTSASSSTAAAGYIEEFHIARAWRDQRLFRIGGGTTETMRYYVAKLMGLSSRPPGRRVSRCHLQVPPGMALALPHEAGVLGGLARWGGVDSRRVREPREPRPRPKVRPRLPLRARRSAGARVRGRAGRGRCSRSAPGAFHDCEAGWRQLCAMPCEAVATVNPYAQHRSWTDTDAVGDHRAAHGERIVLKYERAPAFAGSCRWGDRGRRRRCRARGRRAGGGGEQQWPVERAAEPLQRRRGMPEPLSPGGRRRR